MGGDDFRKRGSGMGLRDAISKARQSHLESVEERACELFTEMRIIERVTMAISHGRKQVTIPFPEELTKKNAESSFAGELKWGLVVDRFEGLLVDEGVEVEVKTSSDANGQQWNKYCHYRKIIVKF